MKKTFVGLDIEQVQSGSTVKYSGNTWISELLTNYTLNTDFYNLTANTYTKGEVDANFLSASTLSVAVDQIAIGTGNSLTGDANLTYSGGVLNTVGINTTDLTATTSYLKDIYLSSGITSKEIFSINKYYNLKRVYDIKATTNNIVSKLLEVGDLLYSTSNFGNNLISYNKLTYVIKIEYTFPYAINSKGLIQANDGLLYGATTNNGTNLKGYIFSYDIQNTAYTNLYNFNYTETGAISNPFIQANDGLLYGTTNGILFSYDINTSGFTSLYIFTTGTTGYKPNKLIQASDGLLYGTTQKSSGDTEGGTLFSYDLQTSAVTYLYDFTSLSYNNPHQPLAGVTEINGILYGTTRSGGVNNYGSIFSYDLQTSALTVLYDFNYSDGDAIWVDLLAINNTLYGAAAYGGVNGYGTIYSYDTLTTTFTNLYNFTQEGGWYMDAGLIQATDGFIYGTTLVNGKYGYGSLYKYSIDVINANLINIDEYGLMFLDSPNLIRYISNQTGLTTPSETLLTEDAINSMNYWALAGDIISTKPAIYSSIVGGNNNQLLNSLSSSIIGGDNNIIDDNSYAVAIIAGQGNISSAATSYSAILAGANNQILATNNASVVGGEINIISTSSLDSAILAGGVNVIDNSTYSVILGGQLNNILSLTTHSAILAGQLNALNTSYFSSIIAGQGNAISNSTNATILGGQSNALFDTSTDSSIIGGYSNILSTSLYSIILGGQLNVLSDTSNFSAIIVGEYNIVSASTHSSIIGGQYNTLTGTTNSVIIGGQYNTLTATTNSVIIAAQDINGTASNTLYTTNIIAKSLTLSSGITALYIQSTSGITNSAQTLLTEQAIINAITWSNIKNKPTTISGYGITDAYTKTETNANFLSASTANYLSANTINVATNQVAYATANNKLGGSNNFTFVNNTLTVLGNLVISGTTTTIYTENLNIKDNLILINSGETGTGVTLLYAGIEVDRGDAPNYVFLFDEIQDNFRIGESANPTGGTQAVATRQDTPLNGGIAYWNSSIFRFDTSTGLTFDGSTLFVNSIKTNLTTVTNSAYTLNSIADIFEVLTATTLTLPTAVGITGQKYTVKSNTLYTITINTTDGQTIDGQSYQTINSQYMSLTIVSNGQNWLLI